MCDMIHKTKRRNVSFVLKIQLGEIYISKLKQVLIKQGGDFQTFNCKITKDFKRWLNYLSWRFDI